MSLLICPECRAQLSDAAPACPRCGVPADRIRTLLRERSDAQAHRSFVFVGVILSFLLFVALCSAVNSWRDGRAARKVREATEAEQRRASEAEAAAKKQAEAKATLERTAAFERLKSGHK